jgi:hypothetical protein
MLSALLIALAALSQPPASLDRGVELYREMKPKEARAVLKELLGRHPRTAEAAKAHLYLGLIAFVSDDDIDIDGARLEFRQSLSLDPTLELPLGVSPKIRVVFEQIRGQLVGSLDARPPTSVLVLAPAPAAATAEASASASPRGPAPVSVWVLLGLGAAAGVTGLVFGVISNGPAAQAQTTASASTAQSLQNQTTTDRIVADSCFGAAIIGSTAALFAYLFRGPAAAAPAAP